MWIKFKKRIISIKYLSLIALFFFPSVTHAQENFSQLYGLWQWEKTKIQVDVNKCSYNPNKVCAIIASGDRKGSFILRSIAKNNDKFIGKMIHPINGRSYDAEIKMIDNSKVEISGCTPGKAECQVSTWKRLPK